MDKFLHTFAKQDLTLEQAFSDCGDLLTDAAVLVYSSTQCRLGRFHNGRPDYHGQVVADETIFEARVFNAAGELRWIAEGDPTAGQGRAVFLTEIESQKPKEWSPIEEKNRPLFFRKGQYILWGQCREAQEGWVKLFEHRVGNIWAPFSAGGNMKSGDRLAITYAEYIATADKSGNQAVVAERLTGLTLLETPKEKGNHHD